MPSPEENPFSPDHLHDHNAEEVRRFFEEMRFIEANPSVEQIIRRNPEYLSDIRELEEMAVDYFDTVVETNRERGQMRSDEYDPVEYEEKGRSQSAVHDRFIDRVRELLRKLNQQGDYDLVEFARDWYPIGGEPNRAPIALFALDLARRVFVNEIRKIFIEAAPSPEELKVLERDLIDTTLQLLQHPKDETLQQRALLIAKQIDPDKTYEEIFWDITSGVYS